MFEEWREAAFGRVTEHGIVHAISRNLHNPYREPTPQWLRVPQHTRALPCRLETPRKPAMMLLCFGIKSSNQKLWSDEVKVKVEGQ